MENSPILYLHADLSCGLGHRRRLETLQTAWDANSEWIGTEIPSTPGIFVVDDYYYNEESFKKLKDAGHLTVYFTEFACPYKIDILINQNIGADKLLYGASVQLLGTQFFMLRQEYLGIRRYGHEAIFDADSVNRKLLPMDFANNMAMARAIICSAGLTAYEALYLEKPLLLRVVAENQRRTYEGLIEKGYAVPYNDENQERLKFGWIPTVRSGREIIDGGGPQRVAQALRLMWAQVH